jgi:hypothetical protein
VVMVSATWLPMFVSWPSASTQDGVRVDREGVDRGCSLREPLISAIKVLRAARALSRHDTTHTATPAERSGSELSPQRSSATVVGRSFRLCHLTSRADKPIAKPGWQPADRRAAQLSNTRIRLARPAFRPSV